MSTWHSQHGGRHGRLLCRLCAGLPPQASPRGLPRETSSRTALCQLNRPKATNSAMKSARRSRAPLAGSSALHAMVNCSAVGTGAPMRGRRPRSPASRSFQGALPAYPTRNGLPDDRVPLLQGSVAGYPLTGTRRALAPARCTRTAAPRRCAGARRLQMAWGALVMASAVNSTRGAWHSTHRINGAVVTTISAFLSPENEWSPKPLQASTGKSFQGPIVLDTGFTSSQQDA